MRSFCRYSTEGQQPRPLPPDKTNCPSLMAAHPEIQTNGGGTAVSRSGVNTQILPFRDGFSMVTGHPTKDSGPALKRPSLLRAGTCTQLSKAFP